MSLKRLTAQLACAGVSATLIFGLAATGAHADTAGVKLELDQSVSFVADRQGHLFFASGAARAGVLVTDKSGYTIARIATPGITDLALAPDGSALYAAATGSTQILKIDPVSLTVIATYQLPQPQCPTSVAVVGSYVAFGYSCNGQWGGVGFLNLAAPTAPPVTVSSGNYYNPLVRAVPGQSKVLVADQGLSPTTFTVVQIADGAATVRASTSSPNCQNLSDVAISPDGLTFTPACGAPYNFGRYSLTTFTQIGTFAANPYPNAAAYSADGEHFAGGMNGIYNKDVVEYQLSNTATPSLLYSIDQTQGGDANLNGAPRGVAFSADGSRLYLVTQNTLDGNVVLHTMPASGVAGTDLTITSSTKKWLVGKPVTISGTMGFTDGSGSEGRSLSVRRSIGGVTTTLPALTTRARGAYSFIDTPRSTGNASYTVSFAGDAWHPSSSASVTVSIGLRTTSLRMTATRSGGWSVRVTAHLGATHTNRAVTISANGRTVASGKVNSAGNLVTRVWSRSAIRLAAKFSGDAWYRPAAVSLTLKARSPSGRR